MQLRTRLSSSPIKVKTSGRVPKVEAEWSDSSPQKTESSSRRHSNRLSMTLSPSSSIPSTTITTDNSSLSATEEASSPVATRKKSKRFVVVDDEVEEFVDILSDPLRDDEARRDLFDSSLHGLLEIDEISDDNCNIDELDRELYETAFNRTENPGHTGNETIFKNRIAAGEGARGKGKDLLGLMKQRGPGRGPKAPSIRKIYFGTDVSINPWYSAPYPSEYHSSSGELWICEFCLQYMKKPCTAQRHLLKCHGQLPPGDEIYRDIKAGISVFEINGRDAKLYCQNLCLLAKMFLDHKTLYYDVDPFLFYVLVEWKRLPSGRVLSSFVGYFSKEKINPAGYNVSCILTMPHHQRKGYGSFLIDFSYLLSRKEGRLGTPEKPLSDLGLFSYVSYWKSRLLDYFSDLLPKDFSEKPRTSICVTLNLIKISAATGMTENDILSTLEYLKMLRFDIITPDPINHPLRQILQASILIDVAVIEAYRAKTAARPQLIAHEQNLRWHPYSCTK